MIPPRLRFIAVGLIGLVLLTACGDQFVPPAAVVNGVPITQETLQERLDVALADPSVAGQLSGPEGDLRRADLSRQVLGFLIRQQIIHTYARAHGIAVTEAEVDESVQEIIEEVGSQESFDRELRLRRLTLADVRENIRESLLSNRVRDAVGRERLGGAAPPAPEDVDRAFGNWLRDQLSRADIEVNPRFGGFDVEQATVCRVASTAGDLACPQA